jgi:hypothetical protein
MKMNAPISQSVEYGMDVKVVMDTLASPTHVALVEILKAHVALAQTVHTEPKQTVTLVVVHTKATTSPAPSPTHVQHQLVRVVLVRLAQ